MEWGGDNAAKHPVLFVSNNNSAYANSGDANSVYIIFIQPYTVYRLTVPKNQRRRTKLKFLCNLYFIPDTFQCVAIFCLVTYLFNSFLRIRNFHPKINTCHQNLKNRKRKKWKCFFLAIPNIWQCFQPLKPSSASIFPANKTINFLKSGQDKMYH